MLRRHFLTAPAIAAGMLTVGTCPMLAEKRAGNVLDYGAKPDGKTLNTPAIQRAIDEASAAGGGVVYVAPGDYLVGGLQMKSGVTLYLEAGARLLGSIHIQDYTHYEGLSEFGDTNGHYLIYARGAQDIAICGLGCIDGQGSAYWRNTHRQPVKQDMMWADVATFDYMPIDNHRPSPMLEFAQCGNVHVTDVTLKNAPGWTLRPVACDGVFIDGIQILNPRIGPNTDGLDITASCNVFVSNCHIDTGDDAICIKSENPYGKVLPTRNITITNCVVTTVCNGFKLGTASLGGFENIVFSNSVIYSDGASPLNAHVIGGINIEVVDGGHADGISVSNIRMENVRTPIFVRLGTRNNGKDSYLRNISIQGVEASGAVLSSSITGVPGLRVQDVSITDCRIRTVEAGRAEWARPAVSEHEKAYPEARMFGRLPAFGFYLRHADRIRLRNLELIADRSDARPAIVADDVNDLIVSGVETRGAVGATAVMDLFDTSDAYVTGNRAPAGQKVLAAIRGSKSARNLVQGNAVRDGQQETQYSEGARPA